MKTRILTRKAVVSVVIPCFNEETVLPLLYQRLTAATSEWPCEYRVILVDDGSTDESWSIMRQLRAKDDRWQLVRLARNFGHQTALWTGLQRAKGDLIVVLDADLQDPPEVLPHFFAQWEQGYDVVYGVRIKRKEGLLKRMAYSSYYRILSWLSEVPIPLDSGDFCLMDRRVLDAILQTSEQEPFVRGLRAWVGFSQIALPIERDARVAGEPKYTFRMLMGLAVNGIFSFSTRPLRLASYLGLSVSVCSFLGVFFTLLQKIFHSQFAALGLGPVPGFATIVIAVLFMGGVQLVGLGILGEYVGRIYANSKGRRQSVVSETVGLERQADEPFRKAA